MALSVEELVSELSVIEPEPDSFARISAEDIPALRELFARAEPWMAARVVFVTARFADRPDARDVILDAARDARPEPRTAAAAVAKHFPPEIADRVLLLLLGDQNVGVRRSAVLAVRSENGQAVKDMLASMSATDQPALLRTEINTQLRTVGR